MNGKTTAIVVVIAIAIIAAIAAAVLLTNNGGNNDNGGGEKAVIETGRVVIYGNANNDDYLDSRDTKFIQDIIDGKATWNKTKNPFADTNTDGKITADDVALLQKFINKEKATMYYYTCLGTVDSIKYPITGNIAVNFSYGLDAAIVLGCYDRVVAADHQTVSVASSTETKYPGLGKLADVGDPRDDAEALVLQVKNNDVQAIFGYSGSRITTIEDNVAKSGSEICGINLTLNHTEAYGSDKYGSILTMGIMLGCEDRAYEFIGYVDKVADYIASKDAKELTYVMPEYEEEAPGSTSTTWIMTTSKGNWASGCNHTVEYLPLNDLYYKQFDGGFIEVEIEDIVKKNPDVIILSSWGVVNENMTMQQVLDTLKPFYDVYKNTQAYKNNQVYCIAYESYGPVPGIAGDVLLASYLWPDVYEETYGWELLQEYYDKYTKMKVDVKKIPTLSPFKLKDVY
ncbi:MAG: ABC transporter substrate-binding protein [Candidatus Methanomethylophilaceae archaeon]|nr:ABC transporter substrate-binding protein [Candidatus Methanomethylophilaceae archaeon]